MRYNFLPKNERNEIKSDVYCLSNDSFISTDDYQHPGTIKKIVRILYDQNIFFLFVFSVASQIKNLF